MGKIYVSCTTTSKRLEYLYYMVKSIERQTLRPACMVINVSRAPYLMDEGLSEIPSWLEQNWIRINWVENTGSYRKLLPLINEVEDEDLVITADDDILYPRDWLQQLVNASKKYPKSIVSARSRYIRKGIGGRFLGYYYWQICNYRKESFWLLPTTGGGAVFRRQFFDLDILNNPVFLDLAPTSDDLWFRACSMLKNVPVYVDPFIGRDSIFLDPKDSLRSKNFLSIKGLPILVKLVEKVMGRLTLSVSKNDRAWKLIIKHLNLET